MRLLPSLAVLTLWIVSQAASADVPEFIDKPGDYKLFDGKLVIKVKSDRKELRFGITYASPGGSFLEVTSTRPIDKTEGWFIAPFSVNEVWLYQGSGLLQLDEFKAMQHSTANADLATTMALLKRAPRKVVNRLPLALSVHKVNGITIIVRHAGPHVINTATTKSENGVATRKR